MSVASKCKLVPEDNEPKAEVEVDLAIDEAGADEPKGNGKGEIAMGGADAPKLWLGNFEVEVESDLVGLLKKLIRITNIFCR